MSCLAVVIAQGLGPEGLLALLKATRINGDVPRLASARTRHKEGREELCKGAEDIEGKGLHRVSFGKGEDSFEAIPQILAGRATGDQSWDAEVSQIPQMTCLVEVLEERECAIARWEIHEVRSTGMKCTPSKMPASGAALAEAAAAAGTCVA
jgi:hypothetical protein